ncbi:hypothetical protein DFH07DRAFT_977425 [Mycena maculata]|uniref:DUF6535 domain-containing protein n=1 Tax=Mycena maculata TaxID=230809 RepID=A0AAD7N4V5_9AGAR|nr:hypothetical protein DFH07DRAFT_977425 [Mycena maculata]
MESSSANVDSQPVLSDNDKLIQVLQSCFKKQEEQAERYVVVSATYYSPQWSPRLQQAVDGLKPKIPATDKKTNFWNLYKTLADEYDREFQQKYSTDLDTALIFIQPQIAPHHTPPTILVAQSLLYISLGSTLLAALLAVLGKQWLMYYMAAGERGTLEARGLERQRKFDGLRKWKFDMVMQVFPLLLQFGLFLFAAGLSVYLWTSHVSLAIIALVMTSLGSIAYISLLLSAVVSPDSPFQTPLAPLVAWLIPTALWMKLIKFSTQITGRLPRFIRYLYSTSLDYIHCSQGLLPSFTKPQGPESNGRSKKLDPNSLFDISLLVPSLEVPAVSWVLETSTDPLVVAAASELVVELQWSVRMDVRPQLTRLRDNLLMCLKHYDAGDFIGVFNVMEGMSLHALHLGRAYCTLRCVCSWNLNNDPEPRFEWDGSTFTPELDNIIEILVGNPSIVDVKATRWALHNIPSLQHLTHGPNLKSLKYFLNQSKAIPDLDELGFTDYLFCVTSFLVPVSTSDMVWMDKSQFQLKVLEHFFQTLSSSLKKGVIAMNTVAEIIDITGQIAIQHKNTVWDWDVTQQIRTSIVYQFCHSLPHSEGWIDLILATGCFTEEVLDFGASHKVEKGVWVDKALAQIPIPSEDAPWDDRIVTGVNHLLRALLYYNCAPAKGHIHLILHALLIPSNISANAAKVLLEEEVRVWYQDDDLRPILQNESLWSSLSNTVPKALCYTHITQYVELGHTLAGIPDWWPHIREELCSWIAIFFSDSDLYNDTWQLSKKYSSVLTTVFEIDAGNYEFADDCERACGLSFIALSKFWEDFDFETYTNLLDCIKWLKCTCQVALRTGYSGRWNIQEVPLTSRFKEAFSDHLCAALTHAAMAARQRIMEGSSNDSGEINPGIEESIANDILEEIARRIPKSTNPDPEEHGDQEDIYSVRWQVQKKTDALEKAMSVSVQ